MLAKILDFRKSFRGNPGCVGIDVSGWQGYPGGRNPAIDWEAVDEFGCGTDIDFAYMKASEGTRLMSKSFPYNWKECHAMAEGILTGAYHFLRFDKDPVKQIQRFFRFVDDQHCGLGNLPPAIDLEWHRGYKAAHKRWQERLDFVMRALAEVEHLFERRPVLYVPAAFWKYRLGKSPLLNAYPAWIPGVGKWRKKPPKTGSWQWTFWQYAHKGRVPGIKARVDLNRFNGTYEELRQFCGLGAAEMAA